MHWFPLSREMMEQDDDFRALPPSEKLYYWLLLHEFTAHDPGLPPYYKSDLYFAAALGLSEGKIRKARRKFKALGWIDYRPGMMIKGQNLATVYHSVRWAKIPQKEGNTFFAKMHRFAFEVLLSKVRANTFKHKEIVLYVYLVYSHCKFSIMDMNEDYNFFIYKGDFARISRVAEVSQCLRKLYESYTFKGGNHLFEMKDCYHKVYFNSWAQFSDPSECEIAAKNQERYRQEVAIRFSQMKIFRKPTKRRKKARPRVETEGATI